MERDIRSLFEKQVLQETRMPKGHEKRFLKKLDKALPKPYKRLNRISYYVAASVLLVGLGVYALFQSNKMGANNLQNETLKTITSLGDVSPSYKIIEDYYLNSINAHLVEVVPSYNTKKVFDDYMKELDALNKEYEHLSLELRVNSSKDILINALLTNLDLRLKLLLRLKEQLEMIEKSKADNHLNETLL
jgi:hypothetical protein